MNKLKPQDEVAGNQNGGIKYRKNEVRDTLEIETIDDLLSNQTNSIDNLI